MKLSTESVTMPGDCCSHGCHGDLACSLTAPSVWPGTLPPTIYRCNCNGLSHCVCRVGWEEENARDLQNICNPLYSITRLQEIANNLLLHHCPKDLSPWLQMPRSNLQKLNHTFLYFLSFFLSPPLLTSKFFQVFRWQLTGSSLSIFIISCQRLVM